MKPDLMLHVVAKAPIYMLVFAMYISSNRSANGDIAGAGGYRQKESRWHDHFQDLIQAHSSSCGNGAGTWIQCDPIKC